MPKLQDDVASKVDQAEDGFLPVEEGIYILSLKADVDVKDGDAGPYWRWTFEVPETHPDADGVEQPQEKAGRRFWTNTSLSAQAFFKLKETFAAFGVPTNTDTEDLVGRRVKAHIIIKTIQGGQRKGELGNEISKLYPLDYVEDAVAANGSKVDTAKGGDNSDPLF